jgi:hypothetical protein
MDHAMTTSTLSLSRGDNTMARARLPIADDKAMLKAAAELTRDLVAPRPALYWTDLIASWRCWCRRLAGRCWRGSSRSSRCIAASA